MNDICIHIIYIDYRWLIFILCSEIYWYIILYWCILYVSSKLCVCVMIFVVSIQTDRWDTG